MTQEEKAKRYDEVLEQAKNWYVDAQIDFKKSLEALLPELKESEDEKIRKALINVFATHKDYEMFFGVSVADILAWLEKQGSQKLANSAKTCKDEQNPTDKEIKEALRTEYEKGRADAIAEMQNPAWSEEDEEFLRRAINATKDAYPITAKWLKSLKSRVQSKQEWSDENDLILETIIEHIIPNKPFIANGFTDEELVTWLKSLRPQNRWKPTELQMDVLLDEVNAWTKGCPK